MIPNDVGRATQAQRIGRLYTDLLSGWSVPMAPAVVDARDMEVGGIVDELARIGVPMLVHIPESLSLRVADPALTGYGAVTLTAREICRAGRGNRYRTLPLVQARTERFVAAVGVALPGGTVGARPLLLLGSAAPGQREPDRLWLTDMVDAHPETLAKLTALAGRVDQDFTDIAQPVGVSDYTGRSFNGWHRHMTLVSAAHAVVALQRLGGAGR